MNQDDVQFIHKCDESFNTISGFQISEITRYFGLSSEDLKQEFYLFCWELKSSGKLNQLSGRIFPYFLASFKIAQFKKGNVFDFNQSVKIDDLIEGQTPSVEEILAEDSVLEKLLKHEELIETERQEKEAEAEVEALKAYLGYSKPHWVMRLWKEGLNQQQIADIGGINQASVSRILKGKQKSKPIFSSSSKRRVQSLELEQDELF
jgi:predicted XRE-type DNA-binding protein